MDKVEPVFAAKYHFFSCWRWGSWVFGFEVTGGHGFLEDVYGKSHYSLAVHFGPLQLLVNRVVNETREGVLRRLSASDIDVPF